MTGFELKIVGLILVAFFLGVVIGYILRTRLFSHQLSETENGDVKLESLQEKTHNALLRGSSRSPKSSKLAGSAKRSKTDTSQKKEKHAVRQETATDETAASAARPDNLQEIKGIGAVLEKKLNALGIERFEQIASWSETDIAKIDETLNFRGRIQRERWVEQAQELAKRSQAGS